jgi:potassium efflux system protein
VLPALAMLDSVQLWGTTAAGAEGTRWITLGNLAVAVITLMLTLVAAKSLPGVLEILLLKNLPLDAGVRYAVTTVSQYVLAAVGVVVAFNTIGIGWSKVQWLAAALSVGVGFGLQEIIANFICGLILLFERPIRVGDIVTVGDVMGTVSRIRIRATTITNWDRMEYVVPNKDLITGRLLNWTLSNTVNRIVISVGIVHRSDTDKARDLLLAAARDHPLVMRDPEPLATFEGFGEIGLTMVLRCYLADFSNRLTVIHELHTAIKKAFDTANVEIAFPLIRWGGKGSGQ